METRCGHYLPLVADCAEVGVLAVCKYSVLGKAGSHIHIWSALVRELFDLLAMDRVQRVLQMTYTVAVCR